MNYLISFLFVFIIMYLFYFFFIIINKKSNTFNKDKIKSEESYIIAKYHIDMKKVNYKKYLHLISIVNSLIFGFAFATSLLIKKSVFFQIIVGVLVMMPLIMIFYDLIGRHYVKKGYTKKIKKD